MSRSFSRFMDRWLPRGGFARSVSIVAGGTAMAQAIAIAASPILTRIYKPVDFGGLQVFISLMALALVAASGRYEVALLLPEDEQSAIDILAVAILCVCLTAAVAAGAVLICHYHWMLPASMSVLRGHLWLLPVSVLGGGLYQSLSYWVMRHNGYQQIASTKFTQAGAQVATQLGAGCLIHGSLGLLLGDAAGRIIGSGRFLRELWRNYHSQIRAIRPSRMMQLGNSLSRLSIGFDVGGTDQRLGSCVAVSLSRTILWSTGYGMVRVGQSCPRCSGRPDRGKYCPGLYLGGGEAIPIGPQAPHVYLS